jgi:hypothetical protein
MPQSLKSDIDAVPLQVCILAIEAQIEEVERVIRNTELTFRTYSVIKMNLKVQNLGNASPREVMNELKLHHLRLIDALVWLKKMET